MPRKPQYIGKYDFMRYFTRPKSLWFWTNEELEREFNKNRIESIDDEDEESDNDTLEVYKEKKFSNELNNIENKRFPEIEEGKILEKRFIEYIKTSYAADEYIEIENSSNEEMAEKTKKLLSKDSIVIFQATFINKDLKIITKVDALIKEGSDLTIIEFKGTTTTKLKHIYDLYFQYRVLKSLGYNPDIKLAVIKYSRNKKDEVSFLETESCNETKNGRSGKSGQSLEFRQNEKIGQGQDDYFTMKEIFEGHANLKKMDPTFINNFKAIINNLLDHNLVNEFKIELTEFSKSNIGYEYQKEIKEMLSIKYPAFGYSALNERNWSFYPLIEKYIISNKYDFFNATTNMQKKNLIEGQKDLYSNEYIKYLFERIEDKKVYFDFETINNAIAIFDNTLPFQQIVVQCSIIKMNKDKEESVENLIVDPLEVKVDFLKKVVDSIYEEDNNVTYLVYYHSFEKSRLNEMKEIINEDEYYEKIDKIIKNLFDLIDFFKISGKESEYSNTAPVLFKEAKLYSSIKKILPILENNYRSIISGAKAKDYKTLGIQNGSEALAVAKFRSFNMISDNEWKSTVEDLKIYCENDVRAMIAIYLFIENLYKNI